MTSATPGDRHRSQDAAQATPGPSPGQSSPEPFAQLRQIAESSLRANIVQLPSGPYLRAGSMQFQGLWTRDFCFASRGLYEVGRADVVKNQLSLYLRNLHPRHGFAPRFFDSVLIEWRYILKWLGKSSPLRDPLKPSYRGWYFQENIDSNALILIAALDYVARTQDHAWWKSCESQLVRAYRFYDRYVHQGLVSQPGWSDWQDSVRRKGKTSFTNLLYYVASRSLAAHPAFGITPGWLEEFRKTYLRTFQDLSSGVLTAIQGHPHVSLDSNLLALDLGFFEPGSEEARNHWNALKKHPIWRVNDETPGMATVPDYPRNWVGAVEWLFNVRHYHDHTYWSWLMALSAKVAMAQGERETGHRLLQNLERMALRDEGIAEIYIEKPPFEVWGQGTYQAEKPFSWGAGMTLDALTRAR